MSVVSFNVRGLRDRVKRRAIMRHLHITYPNHIVVLQETHSTPEITSFWESEWGSRALFSHGTTHQAGVAILFPRTFKDNIKNQVLDDNGRYIWVEFKSGNDDFAVFGVYAPAVDLQVEKIAFLEKVHDELAEISANNVILCGDFNLHFGELDAEPGKFRTSGASKKLCELTEEFFLKDIWRCQNPDIREYTWRKLDPLQQSRIDYVFISETLSLNYKVACNIVPGVKSDHSMVEMTVRRSERKRGPGIWRFNNELLDDPEFVESVKSEIAKADNRLEQYHEVNRPGLLIEMLLSSIRVIAIRRSKVLAREVRVDEQQAVDKVAVLEKNLSTLTEAQKVLYDECRTKLDEIKCRRAKRAILQSGAKWVEEGEKATKYFLSRGKQLSAQKAITVLDHNGQLISDDKGILEHCASHFAEVFRSRGIDKTLADRFLGNVNIPSLSENEQRLCEGNITGEECKRALDSMNNRKAPGISGFTVEFFRTFWPEVEGMIVNYINAAQDDDFFITQRRGVITLIPKKGEQNTLQSRRPICLLDILYKIVAKVMAIRLGNVIGKLVSKEQTGFIKNRYIGENLRLVADMIHYCESDEIEGVMIACDYRSAFDSLEHEFIFGALKAYNFGDSFVKWIKLLYRHAKLSIINNGHTSRWFNCSRGTFQGSPISGMLFALSVEILAINLREDCAVNGIKVSGQEVKISLYADDITIFAKDARSAERALQVMEKFSGASGLCLNVSKSKVMWLGPMKDCNLAIGGIAACDKVKILGLWFSAKEPCIVDNVEPVCRKIEAVINVWSQRTLTIKGRVTISKSLLAAQLVYASSCIRIPQRFLARIQSRIMKFLWRGRPPKVAKNVVIQSIEEGGLNAPDVQLFCKSLQMGWLRRMETNVDAMWRKVLQARLGSYEISDWLKTPLDRKQINRLRIPMFYKDILSNVQRFIDKPMNVTTNIRKEMLWHNRSIRIALKPVFYTDMYSAGIKMINDLIRPDGTFLSIGELRNKYPRLRIDFLRYEGLIRAIPRMWKSKLATERGEMLAVSERNAPLELQFPGKKVKINLVRCRNFYSAELIRTSPAALVRWEEEGYNFENWSDVFKIPYACTSSTRLQSLQFRVLHRYLPTRRFLFIRKVTNDQTCRFCNEIENTVHFLYECQSVKHRIWDRMFRDLHIISDDPRRDAVFGIIDGRHAHNLIIILIKQYIVSCKLSTPVVEPSFFGVKGAIKHCIETERIIARKNEKLEKFRIKWNGFIDEDGQIQC